MLMLSYDVISYAFADAAGRARDHSDTDKGFAESVGVAFHTEDQFFKQMHK